MRIVHYSKRVYAKYIYIIRTGSILKKAYDSLYAKRLLCETFIHNAERSAPGFY